jgi:hypothetical protein
VSPVKTISNRLGGPEVGNRAQAGLTSVQRERLSEMASFEVQKMMRQSELWYNKRSQRGKVEAPSPALV